MTESRTGVMLVDDHAEMRTHLADLLLNWGCEVTESGSDKLSLSPDHVPDVIICDRLCLKHVAELLQSTEAEAIKVIVLTDAQTRETSGPAFVAGYLGKPVKPAQLRALLQHLFVTA